MGSKLDTVSSRFRGFVVDTLDIKEGGSYRSKG